jgi:hypothetical protein
LKTEVKIDRKFIKKNQVKIERKFIEKSKEIS